VRVLDSGRVAIRVGKEAVEYALSELAAELEPGQRGFRLVGPSVERTYDVLLDPLGRHTCECLGFLRWGHCKHVDSLAALTGFMTDPARASDKPIVTRPIPPCPDCGTQQVESADGLCCPECDYWSCQSHDAAVMDPFVNAA
jgi:hypothetical protein